jgi:hypothetical protein
MYFFYKQLQSLKNNYNEKNIMDSSSVAYGTIANNSPEVPSACFGSARTDEKRSV